MTQPNEKQVISTSEGSYLANTQESYLSVSGKNSMIVGEVREGSVSVNADNEVVFAFPSNKLTRLLFRIVNLFY